MMKFTEQISPVDVFVYIFFYPTFSVVIDIIINILW